MKTRQIKLKNNIVLKNNIMIAPMAGWTDVGFRSLAMSFGAGICFTEMISAKALVYGNKKTKDMLAVADNESPCGIQLFGNDAETLVNAIRLPELQKFDVININMGCPAPKIIKNKEGCYLMKDIDNARAIVRACVNATIKPVSVKFRKGWNDKNANAVDFAKMCEQEGVSFIVVHGRTCEQGYSGVVDYDIIKQVARSVKIPVIANGDIVNEEKAKEVLKLTGADGVMIGRGVIGNLELIAKCSNKNCKISKKLQIFAHIDILNKYFSEKYTILNIRKHLCLYAKGRENANEFIKKIMTINNLQDLKNEVDLFFD